jgi:hypothetical protein
MRFLVLVLCCVVGACAPYTIAETTSIVTTDKMMEDHVISALAGKNCSTVRVGRGEPYCEEDEVMPQVRVHCYRNLGGVTCYDRPDPYKQNHQRLGDNDHNYTPKPTRRSSVIRAVRDALDDGRPYDPLAEPGPAASPTGGGIYP